MRRVIYCLLMVSSVLGISTGAIAGATITLDENGNGNINGVPLAFTPNGVNPLPPFQSPVLTYTLPFAGVAGNVLLIEPETNVPGDVLQFTGSGTVLFYSATDGDSLAERFSPPIFPFPVTNSVTLTEVTSGNSDGAMYTPAAGQPGFDSSGPTYNFISDQTTAAVPEPVSVGMLLLGGVALLGAGRARR